MKKSSISLLSALGIGAVFGLLMSFLDVIVLIIPFEREWIAYTLVTSLIVMTFPISLLWIRSTKQNKPNMDIDEIELHREKLAYKFIGSTSLFLIIGIGAFFIILLEWREIGESPSGPIAYSLAITSLLYLYGILAQTKALKFHNKYNPRALTNLQRTDDYEKYFESLDEGEKFEQYRVAYKSFYSMHLLFPITLLILFIVSLVSNPQFIAITVVGILWFLMYMIYYREGYKIYKQ